MLLFNICRGHFSSDLVWNLRRKIQTKDVSYGKTQTFVTGQSEIPCMGIDFRGIQGNRHGFVREVETGKHWHHTFIYLFIFLRKGTKVQKTQDTLTLYNFLY